MGALKNPPYPGKARLSPIIRPARSVLQLCLLILWPRLPSEQHRVADCQTAKQQDSKCISFFRQLSTKFQFSTFKQFFLNIPPGACPPPPGAWPLPLRANLVPPKLAFGLLHMVAKLLTCRFGIHEVFFCPPNEVAIPLIMAGAKCPGGVCAHMKNEKKNQFAFF